MVREIRGGFRLWGAFHWVSGQAWNWPEQSCKPELKPEERTWGWAYAVVPGFFPLLLSTHLPAFFRAVWILALWLLVGFGPNGNLAEAEAGRKEKSSLHPHSAPSHSPVSGCLERAVLSAPHKTAAVTISQGFSNCSFTTSAQPGSGNSAADAGPGQGTVPLVPFSPFFVSHLFLNKPSSKDSSLSAPSLSSSEPDWYAGQSLLRGENSGHHI